ncbi:MAG: putative ABC exporter domain-containing protein [Oscillospiraceae bacterium]
MNALSYLLITRFKNSVKTFFKSPARVIFVIIMAGLFGMLLVSGGRPPEPSLDMRGAQELYALVFAFYFVMYILGTWSGLSNGASFFSMADVNNVFVAPFSQKHVLIYGLIRQLGMNFWMAFFLIYQYGWLQSAYGLSIGGLLAILAAYIVVVFCSQLTAMGIYAWSSSNDKRKTLVKRIIVIISAAVLVYALFDAVTAQNKLEAAISGANKPLIDLVPIAGWMRMFVVGVIENDAVGMVLGMCAALLFVGAFVTVLMKLDSDFYEDVLSATEVMHSAISAKKEGRVAESMPTKIKVGKIGLTGGFGASAFFYKHRLESRRSKVFILDTSALIITGLTCVFAYFLRDNGMLPAFMFSVYIMFFSSYTGRWVKELTFPYVYMTPESPFKKLIMLCGETILKNAGESLLVFVLVGIITKASIGEILACALARFCFSLLFIASNVLTDRLFGGIPGKGMQVMFFFLVMLILALPGIVGAAVAGMLTCFAVGLLAMSLWLVAVSGAVLFLCRGILNIAELNG